MNREAWAKLSALERRIRIAKLCGWRSTQWEGEEEPLWELPGNSFTRLRTTKELPDYLNDLNAIHMAVMAMPKQLRMKHDVWLMLICSHEDGTWDLFDVHNATAEQRAEAFILTMEPEP